MQALSNSRGRVAMVVLSFLILIGCGGGGDNNSGPPGTLPFERYTGAFGTIDKPRGWEVITAGQCTTLGFLIRDPANHRRQIFYFGTIGPVYLNQAQKNLDSAYVHAGGYPHTWMDAPVVDPLTPENYLAHWPAIAAMKAAAQYMPQFPPLKDVTVVAVRPQSALLPGGSTSQMRGLYMLGSDVVEGMFLVTVKQFSPYTGLPGGGTAYGNFICGVTAPKGEFPAVVDRLVQSLESFTVTQSYVSTCLAQSQQAWGAVAAAGQTLSEASDIIFEGWQSRNHSEDIMAEQRTDAFRDVERIYDPDTGTVYEVPIGWYDTYNQNRNQYDMSNLQQLPSDNWDLWMAAVLNGQGNIH